MQRRLFLKRFGLGAATLAAAPMVPMAALEALDTTAGPVTISEARVASSSFQPTDLSELVKANFESEFYRTFEQESFFMRFVEKTDA